MLRRIGVFQIDWSDRSKDRLSFWVTVGFAPNAPYEDQGGIVASIEEYLRSEFGDTYTDVRLIGGQSDA